MKILPVITPILVATLLATGCKGPDAVILVTTTGINVEASAAEGTQSTAHVGFNRFEGVIMPGRGPSGSARNQAYPVLSKMDFSSGSLFLPSFLNPSTNAAPPGVRLNQVFATGRAATNAKSVKSLNDDFDNLSDSLAQHRLNQAAAHKFVTDTDADKLNTAWEKASRIGIIGTPPVKPSDPSKVRACLRDAFVGNDEIDRAKLELFVKQMNLK